MLSISLTALLIVQAAQPVHPPRLREAVTMAVIPVSSTQPLLHTVQSKPLRIGVKTVIATTATTQILDLSYTMYLIGTGYAHEANPAMKWAAGHPRRMGLAKSVMAVGSGFALAKLGQKKPKTAIAAGAIMTALTSWVVLQNRDSYNELKADGRIQ